MKPIDNLLFSSIKMPVLDKQLAAKEILNINEKYSFWDNYRHTKMIPLMTKLGITGEIGTSNYSLGDFQWVEYAPKVIIDWFEYIVFPWLGSKSRIMALITYPGEANNEHIDCDPNELNTRQHKFRIVLQGETSTLYFITKQGNIRPPNVETPFIMDGGWPHGMNNFTNNIKVTLALGAPWTGKEDYKDDLYHHLYRNDYTMPDKIDKYWKN